MAGVATIFIAYAPPVDNNNRRLIDIDRKLLQEAGINREDPYAVAKHMMSRQYQEKWFAQVTAQAVQMRREDEQAVSVNDPRQLQAAFTQLTYFIGCTFRNNKQGPTTQGGVPLLGPLHLLTEFSPVVIRNTQFIGNQYDGSDGSANGYAIFSSGSKVEVYDSCFIDNNFVGFAPLQIFGGAEYVLSGNFITEDDAIGCDFAAVSEESIPETDADITCITYDLETCNGDPRVFPPPTSAPTGSSAAAFSWKARLGSSLLVASLSLWLLAIHV